MSTKKFLTIIIIIGILALIISKYLIQICIVRGNSMYPTLSNKNLILIKKHNFTIHKTDIAVIRKENKIIIKRIVGLPGDKLQIKDGYLYLNEKKYDDYYMEYSGILEKEITLGIDEYFVLGDNRNQSIDSRYEEIGIIYKNEFVGIKIN